MNEVVIDNKKYVVLAEDEFLVLQKNAARKWEPEKEFTIEEARAHSVKRIREWAAKQ